MDTDTENVIVAFLGELRLLRERTYAIRAQQPKIFESVSRMQSHAESIVKILSNPDRKSANPYSQGPGRLQRAVMDQRTGW